MKNLFEKVIGQIPDVEFDKVVERFKTLENESGERFKTLEWIPTQMGNSKFEFYMQPNAGKIQYRVMVASNHVSQFYDSLLEAYLRELQVIFNKY